MNNRNCIFFIIACLFCTGFFSSCNTYKNVAYLEDFPDTSHGDFIRSVPFESPVIKPDDILSVTIQSIDNDVTALLNSGPGTNAQSNAMPATGSSQSLVPTAPLTGYLVDKNGYIELPFTGKLKVAGLTTVQVKDAVTTALGKYFKGIIVTARFANYKITVLGEVLHPATYIVPNEKVNIFDALGMAGDLTIFGQRENILLLRDSADGKKLERLNLNSKDIIKSPYFFLQSNDVVYVQPNKSKVASADAIRNRNITIFASALSVLIVIATRIKY